MSTKKTDLGFKTWRESSERVYSNSGDPIRIVYSGKLDVDGTLVLEKVGEENIYDYIQSFAESVDINNILKRYQNGEDGVLERVQGFYFDTTQLPKTMSDLLNKINFAESEFEKLPVEFKEKYGNDFEQFLCTFDWSDLVKEDSNVDIEEKVKEDEQEQ